MLIYLQVIETPEDEDKFTAIYEAYHDLLFYIAFERMKHIEDAEDAVHHVFMKIAENIKNIEPVSPKTKMYVVTMIDNRVTDVFRVRGRHPVDPYNDELKYSFVVEMEGHHILN